MALLDDILTRLVSEGAVRGSTGWGAQLSVMTDDPDQLVVLFERGGEEPDLSESTYDDQLVFEVQVRAARFGYAAARTKVQDVFDALNDAAPTGYAYVFAREAGPRQLGYDKQNRPVLSMTFEAMKERA